MTLVATPPMRVALAPNVIAALCVLVACLLTAVLMPVVPWVAKWPEAWTLPINRWIGDGVGVVLDLLKPAARALAAALDQVLAAVTFVLAGSPWPAVFGVLAAFGLWVGGRGLGMMTALVLVAILLSGFWEQSMNTLALVTVSVPLALAVGLGVGVLANEVTSVRRVVDVVLDVMQTVPTFAYLVPLLVLFGFGPVVGLIASAIYAAPPMARNVLLGLERVDPEIREAARMAGTTRRQRLWLVEVPAAMPQILIGVNQCVMAAFSMVIIAAVIGAFEDIGWEVLLAVQKARFGPGLIAGLVIVLFAMLMDRMSAALAESNRGDGRLATLIAGAAVLAGILLSLIGLLPAAADLGVAKPLMAVLDEGLAAFTRENGQALDAYKNAILFHAFLPVRIGLDDAVLPFTWGFQWTYAHSVWFFAVAGGLALLLTVRGGIVGAVGLLVVAAIVHTGMTNLPWPAVIAVVTTIGWRAGGPTLAAFAGAALLAILLAGLWERAMLSVYLCGLAVVFCALAGSALGLLAALSPTVWRILRPVCDTLQTIPLFVFLIPAVMIFQIGEFSAFLAIVAYAIAPMIRYTHHGLIMTPPEMIEAAVASGATPGQILRDVRIPYATPSILLGLNQTILFAFAMLCIAALVGTTGLGQSIYIALGSADIGLGISAGLAMAMLAMIADRIVQGFAEEKRAALGL